MIPIVDLKLGFSDAENYRRRENKGLFERLFVRTEALDNLCDPGVSFLIGEKGTGKTAYAIYLANTSYADNNARLRFIRETEYQKFISLKKERQLDLSDYRNIWKVLIYLLIAQQIRETRKELPFLSRFARFKNLTAAIDEYYAHAFSPEIIYALQFVEKSKLAAEILAKHSKVGGELEEEVSFSESRFQTNLLYIQRQFERALTSLKLSRHQLLFIDGIDIRPSGIPFEEYLQCIKGLANAVWDVNNDFFSQVKDSPGRMRVVLLIRPDIFKSLGLQNQNTKIRDNSVILDWRTNYRKHRSSHLFELSDRLLAIQQTGELKTGDAWDSYFPFDSPNVIDKFSHPSSFIGFLRLSLSRPRDIITMLDVLQEEVIRSHRTKKEEFSFLDANHRSFRTKYAEYLMGEIKDHVLFYYSQAQYEQFLKFFEFLEGATNFSYAEFERAFRKYRVYIDSVRTEPASFVETENDFLQFLYDLNVISYVEESERGDKFIRRCYLERSYSNISPKVRTHRRYIVHYGMAGGLNLGRRLRRS